MHNIFFFYIFNAQYSCATMDLSVGKDPIMFHLSKEAHVLLFTDMPDIPDHNPADPLLYAI